MIGRQDTVRRWHAAVGALLPVAVGMVLGGCGGPLPPPLTSPQATPAPTTDLPNIGEIETAIARAVTQRYHVTATARCPARVIERPGKTFDCIAVTGVRARRRDLRMEVTEVSGSYVTFKQVGG